MTLNLYTRDGCHLCYRLAQMIEPWVNEHRIDLRKCDIETNDAWYEAYWSRIPVLMHDDRVILEGKPDEAQVAAAMQTLMRI